VYLSGQIPLDPKTMQIVDGFDNQVKRVFDNLRAVCRAAGGDFDKVVRVTVYLTDLANFAKVNEIMATYFKRALSGARRGGRGVASARRGRGNRRGHAPGVRFAAAIALACAPAFAEEPRAVAPDTFARIVEERLAESETRACIAVGIVAEKTQTKFACTAGAGAALFDEHSLFEIGSITKGFTGLLLADMVRKGEVALDDPVSKYARSGAKLPTRAGQQVVAARPRHPDFGAPAHAAALLARQSSQSVRRPHRRPAL
jgi:reactive intermediate/imine deaminase